MTTITYKEQFDKLTEAYIHDQVDPFINCACFVGNLMNTCGQWSHIREYVAGGLSYLRNLPSDRHTWKYVLYQVGADKIEEQSGGMYSPSDLVRLENIFLKTLHKGTVECNGKHDVGFLVKTHPNYENALYEAFVTTLEELRKIHEAMGEQVEDYQFIKRNLHANTETNVPATI